MPKAILSSPFARVPSSDIGSTHPSQNQHAVLDLTLTVTLVTAAASPVAAKLSSQEKTAAADYKNKLVRGAKVIRQLDQDHPGYDDIIDLTGYSLKFKKCQSVKDFELIDENGDGDGEEDIVLETQRNDDIVSDIETQQQFVVFRLCPTSSENCNYNYGEYMIDLRDYLLYTVEYRTQQQGEMCETCYDQCFTADDDAYEDDYYSGDDAARHRLVDVDCPSCQSDCEKIANMWENFYMDATIFINCDLVSNASDDTPAFYGGPICASEGSFLILTTFRNLRTSVNQSYSHKLVSQEYGNDLKVMYT